MTTYQPTVGELVQSVMPLLALALVFSMVVPMMKSLAGGNPSGTKQLTPSARLGGVRLGEFYYRTNKGGLYEAILAAMSSLYWEDERSVALRKKGPWGWCPTPDEIYNEIPTGLWTKGDVATALREMEQSGIVGRAPYRGYSPYLVPKAEWAEAWERGEGI